MIDSVSIIIPTLNEESYLGSSLRHLSVLDPPVHEIIVVDGGSRDETLQIALSQDVIVLQSQISSRSMQMNQGAFAATGTILCFLHADTQVPSDLVRIMSTTLADSVIACGGFVSLMVGSTSVRWGISLHNFLKTYYGPMIFRPYLFWFKGMRLLFGDQVMFCRKTDFIASGGFDPTLPLMEDADLCLRLVQRGRIHLVNRVVQSSDRRVAKWGAWKATFLYCLIAISWGLGVSPVVWKHFYEDVR